MCYAKIAQKNDKENKMEEQLSKSDKAILRV